LSGYRLAAGGRIDRTRPLSFTFNGRTCQGYAGDTLASALIANGIDVVARSFKYHRPRGILAAGSDETNALVQLESGARAEPNCRATQIELYEGLSARSLNVWPSLRWDLGAASSLFSRLLAAGFYYKTFFWPRPFWRAVYEPALRRMAGLGTAPSVPDRDTYDKTYAHADVVVVGAGPAGLMAADAASRGGARVLLVDEQAEPGGSLLHARRPIEGRPAMAWVAAIVAELLARPEVTFLPRTTAFGFYDRNYLMLVERRTDHLGLAAPPELARQRLWHVRANQVVLATGAHERPLVFPDNDRPGIMLAAGVSSYLNRYGVAPGRRAVIVTNNDSAYETAFDLAAAGVGVAAIVDARSEPSGALGAAARGHGIDLVGGSVIHAVSGRSRLDGVEVRPAGQPNGAARSIACDLLAMSGGWNPAVHLFCQGEGRLRWDENRLCFVPGSQGPLSAGAANGAFDLRGALREGAAAGDAAAAAAGWPGSAPAAAPAVENVYEAPPQAVWATAAGNRRGKAFVDFQHDVTVADIRLAAREGLVSVEHVKRYTTTGMATDQGKSSNVNALAILSETLGRPIQETGTTTFRPPYTPVTYGTLAGRDLGDLLDPIRVTPIHPWHVGNGAVFEDVGQWKRPWYYPRAGEAMDAAVRREAKAARTSLGIQDVSTLGKIELRGPDAGVFLDRVYTNGFSKLGVGRCRYGLMCRDDGMVFDDGVTTRLADDHFFMTTTTGGAGPVLDWLEELLQTDWPDLRVYLTSVTEQWAAIAVAGPQSREVMRVLAPEMQFDGAAFPFLSMRSGRVANVPARVFRISFSGELAYELHVPAWFGLTLWQAVIAAGQRSAITPYGTEAMHLLRAEKGFIIVGQETDGTVTPRDLGMDWVLSKQKPFIGQRSLTRPDAMRADREQLVGLLPENGDFVLPEGAPLVEGRDGRPPMRMIGHVTSSYWSPNLGRSFGLGLVTGGHTRHGTVVHAPLEGGVVPVHIVEPVFWDKDNRRQND
jgi:sarcosine oxidase subunit alpha